MATTTTTTVATWGTEAESFLSGLGNDLGSLVSKIESGFTWAANEATEFENFLVTNLPTFNAAIQNILAALSTATEALVPNLSAIIAAANAAVAFIVSLFEKTGTAAPGGEAAV